MELAYFTFLAFATFNSLRIVSYLPQIVKIARDRNGASAISYATWGLWTAANASTAMYAAVNLGDSYLSLVSAISAACCLIVIGLTMLKRRLGVTNSEREASARRREELLQALAREVSKAGDELLRGNLLSGVRETRIRGLALRFFWCELGLAIRQRLP